MQHVIRFGEFNSGDCLSHKGQNMSQLNNVELIEVLEGHYQILLGDYQAGNIDEATFNTEVYKLQFQDEWGRYWIIGPQTGAWYYYDGYTWNRANPADADKLPLLDDQGCYWQKGVKSGEWYYYRPETEEWVRSDQDGGLPFLLSHDRQQDQSQKPDLILSQSVFKETIVQTRTEQDGRLRFKIEFGLFLLLLSLIFLIRITNITYNTLFVDEAIYATVGEEALSGIFTQNAMTWMYGSYFYPALSAIANDIAGVVGLRILSAILSTTAAVFVFLTTSRLYGQQAGLWAMLLFGLTGVSISLGQVAVYDVSSVALLALALYCLVTAPLKAEAQEGYYLLASAISFSLSVLSKYLAVLYLPALLLIALVLYTSQGRSIRLLITKFLALTLYILGVYGWHYWSNLVTLFTFNGNVYSFQASTRWMIAKVIWEETGLVLVLALAGLFFLRRLSFTTPGFRAKWAIFLTTSLMPFLILSLLVAPIYHLTQENIGSLWKHLVYSLIFLSPLAGRGLATIVWWCRSYRGRQAVYYQIIGAAITLIGLSWFVDHSLDRNWGFQYSWPNVTGVITYIRSHGLTPESHVLAEGGQIYKYYFDSSTEAQGTWDNTWYMEYKEVGGTKAMTTAILDREFDFVVLDGHYNPKTTQELEPVLAKAGYTLEYEELQKLATGQNVHLRVYSLPNYISKEN
jgi:4-amino-4-deoxy-L-arabinose transferase-like glycosyltransferase